MKLESETGSRWYVFADVGLFIFCNSSGEVSKVREDGDVEGLEEDEEEEDDDGVM